MKTAVTVLFLATLCCCLKGERQSDMLWQNAEYFELVLKEMPFGKAVHPAVEFMGRNPNTDTWFTLRNLLDTGSFGAFALAGGYRITDDLGSPNFPLATETRKGLMELFGSGNSRLDKWRSTFAQDAQPVNQQFQLPLFAKEGWKFYMGSNTGGFVAQSAMPYLECVSHEDWSQRGRCPRYAAFYSYSDKLANILDSTTTEYPDFDVISAIWGLAPGASPYDGSLPERWSNWPVDRDSDWIWDDLYNKRECLYFEFNINSYVNSFLVSTGCSHHHHLSAPLIITALESPYWMFATRTRLSGHNIDPRYVTHSFHASAPEIFNIMIDTGLTAHIFTESDMWENSFKPLIPETVKEFTLTLEPKHIHPDSAVTTFSIKLSIENVITFHDSGESWYKGSHLVFGWKLMKESKNRWSFAHPKAILVDNLGNQIGYSKDKLRIIWQEDLSIHQFSISN
ncbi:hypothetical protein QOT17_015227 [Balamuthia mandrillaris]